MELELLESFKELLKGAIVHRQEEANRLKASTIQADIDSWNQTIHELDVMIAVEKSGE